MKKHLLLLMVIVMFVLCFGCGKKVLDNESVPANSSTVNQETKVPVEESKANNPIPPIFKSLTFEPDGKEEKSPELAGDDLELIKNEFAERTVTLMVNENKQTFFIDKNEIKRVEVQKIQNVDTVTNKMVTLALFIDRSVAIVKVSANIQYSFSEGIWKANNFETVATIEELSLEGAWNGEVRLTYYPSTMRKISFVIEKVKIDGLFSTNVTLSAHTTTPSAPDDVFKGAGGIEKGTTKMTITAVEWVKKQSRSSGENYTLAAYADVAKKAYVTANGCKGMDGINLTRIVERKQ